MKPFKTLFISTVIFLGFSFSQLHAQGKEVNVNIPQLSKTLGFDITEKDSTHIELFTTAADWLGVRYKWGGNTRASGVDCSGFTNVMYDLLYDKKIDRSSSSLSKSVPVRIQDPNKLKPGDMVFFATSKRHQKINHVGIYLKDGYFVHASSAKGKVLVSTLLDGFYKKAWRMGGRIPD